MCPLFPPSLQLARLFGPLLLVIAALGIVTSIFRAQSDRFQVRFAPSLVVLVGLTDDAMPLFARLSAEREPGTTLAVLVERPRQPPDQECPRPRRPGGGLRPRRILGALRGLLTSRRKVQGPVPVRSRRRRRTEPALGGSVPRGRRLHQAGPGRHGAADDRPDR